MKKLLVTFLAVIAVAFASGARTVEMSDYGVRPDTGKDMAPKVASALAKIAAKYGKSDITLKFAPGVYHFFPEKAVKKVYYISNHDQPNPKSVGIDLDGWTGLTLDGEGAEFVFDGRMLPVALVNSTRCTLSGFSIDFSNPHIAQVTVESCGADGIVFRPEPWVKSRIDDKGCFTTFGRGWELHPYNGIAFNQDTRHLVFNTSDLYCPLDSVVARPDGSLLAPKWRDSRLAAGTKVVLRTWERPAPGIFVSLCRDTRLNDIKIHYAEGMGLLAQMSENISLEKFGVCLRGDSDPRYFTTQADATHFSGCKGVVDSCDGLYEGMMDDAINVHGTYLKIVASEGDRTLTGRYMHGQTYGFFWGEKGDTVQFVAPSTMELIGEPNVIASIGPADAAELAGAKEFRVTFEKPLSQEVLSTEGVGMENLTWSPSVVFSGNMVRNNRARGSLFSTPRPTLVADNIFDHTSGTAILLCGDCNGWYETGACRDVRIEGNTFINALTNRFQFTEGVISIYPEIPNLKGQTKYFHGGEGAPGIVITGNKFMMFDRPLLYAKSVDGLKFFGNEVTTNSDFPEFHPNRFTFKLQRVRNVVIEDNVFDRPEQVSVDVE